MILSNWLLFFAESNGGDGDSGGASGEGGDTQPNVQQPDSDVPEPDPKAKVISTYERDQDPNRHSRPKDGEKQ
ncbi:MAG: hypothetical protein DRJ47_11070 [Thermoprotei archaeon]|nr:MAG: hypothetical protein DRJ47_11070 [Thermoprotei archaeon]